MTKVSNGWLSGFIGVLIFSGSLPATRLAVISFDPIFLTAARACIAAVLGSTLLILFRQKRPDRNDIRSLILVALGVVIGFPLLSAFALQHISAAHSSIYAGLIPIATVMFSLKRGEPRPRPIFWLYAIAGSLIVSVFALSQGIDDMRGGIGDILMILAVIICGLGYAEGARLSRKLGGWQVISWALGLSFPAMALMMAIRMPSSFSGIEPSAWWGLAYVSLFSMLLGFIFWYQGLAIGGIAPVGQLQLLQPFFALLLASYLLHENIDKSMLFATAATVACVAGAKRYAF